MRKAIGWIGQGLGWILAICKFLADWIGRSTIVDDGQQLLSRVRPVVDFLDAQPAFWFYLFCLAFIGVGLICAFPLPWKIPHSFRPSPPADPLSDVSDDPNEMVPIGDAARDLYSRLGDRQRGILKSLARGLKSPIEEMASGWILELVHRGNIKAFGRWGDGLPMEEITYTDARHSAFEEAFYSDRPLAKDVSIRRGDLDTAYEHWKDANA